jgi:hypothetical protein
MDLRAVRKNEKRMTAYEWLLKLFIGPFGRFTSA